MFVWLLGVGCYVPLQIGCALWWFGSLVVWFYSWFGWFYSFGLLLFGWSVFGGLV